MNAAIYSVSQAFRLLRQSSAAPAVAFTTVPVSMRARSEAIRTAAFAVSWMVAGTFRKVDWGIWAIAWSLVICSWPARKSIVSWMDLLSTLATVRRQTTLTPNGLTSKARFAARFSIGPNAAPIAVA